MKFFTTFIEVFYTKNIAIICMIDNQNYKFGTPMCNKLEVHFKFVAHECNRMRLSQQLSACTCMFDHHNYNFGTLMCNKLEVHFKFIAHGCHRSRLSHQVSACIGLAKPCCICEAPPQSSKMNFNQLQLTCVVQRGRESNK